MPFSLRRRRVRLRYRDLTPDRYLTDGLRLLRVVSRFVNDGSMLVVLEDCVTLDAHALAAVELVALGMRPVRRPKLPPTEPPSSPAPGKPLETDTHAVA
jgi:hypothetical protein